MQLSPFLPIGKIPSISQGIVYGGFRFSEPNAFPPLLVPSFSGLYAIVVPDNGFSPRPFRLLYIGESTNLRTRLCEQHEKVDHWKREAKGKLLHYTYLSSASWTEQQRKDVENALIKQYNPPCNTLLRSLIAPRITNIW